LRMGEACISLARLLTAGEANVLSFRLVRTRRYPRILTVDFGGKAIRSNPERQ